MKQPLKASQNVSIVQCSAGQDFGKICLCIFLLPVIVSTSEVWRDSVLKTNQGMTSTTEPEIGSEPGVAARRVANLVTQHTRQQNVHFSDAHILSSQSICSI